MGSSQLCGVQEQISRNWNKIDNTAPNNEIQVGTLPLELSLSLRSNEYLGERQLAGHRNARPGDEFIQELPGWDP